jgi:hypothetical protein
MPYAFPADLAEQVVARWYTFVSRHERPAPPLPSPEDLRHILETAFLASLTREEGRELRFVLCCAPGIDVPRDGTSEAVSVIPLTTPRPLTVEAIRSIAPAASPTNAAILVRCPAGAGPVGQVEIAGILNVGSNLARARSGRSFYHRPAPYALVIDVRDLGEMHVYRGGIKLAALKGGRLHDQLAFSGLEFLPVSPMLTKGIEALRPRLRRPPHEPERETSDFEWTSLLNTLLCIVNGVQEHEHGGTLLLVTPGAERGLPVRNKYDIAERTSLVADCFVGFVNSRHELEEAQRAAAADDESEAGAVPHLRNATYVAEEDLADAADLAARLTAVDGALVLTTDLRVLGFGAEIALDASTQVQAFEVDGAVRRPDRWPAVDAESFGMRHRSALRFVAVTDDAAAFVVSQDGTVSFFWRQDGRVLIKRNVNTSNPNMVGA